MQLIPQSKCVFVVAFYFLLAVAPYGVIGQTYKYKSYNESQGLPSYVSTQLAQDKHGRLWVITSNGIAFFDGAEWTKVNSLGDSVDASHYSFLERSLNGVLYFFPRLENMDIITYDGSVFNSIKSPSRLSSTALLTRTFVTIINGKPLLAFATLSSYSVYYNGKWNTHTRGKDYGDDRILNFGQYENSLIICTENAVYDWSDGKISQNLMAVLPASYIPIRGMTTETVSLNGVKVTWMYGNNWVGYIDKGKFTCISTSINFIQNYDSGDDIILGDGLDRVFISTHLSCYYVEKSTCTIHPFSVRDQESITWFTDMIFDNENNLWFTSQRSIGKINSFNFINYFPPVNNNDNEVSSILELSSEKFFFGSKYGYYIFNNGKITPHEFTRTNDQPISSNRVGDAIIDASKNVYFLAGRLGLCRLMEDESYKIVVPYDQFPEDITSLTLDPQGEVTAVGQSNLYKYKNGKLVTAMKLFDSKRYVRKILFSKNDEIFIATTEGTFFYNNGKAAPIRFEQSGDNVSSYCLSDDGSGNIIIGNANGLYVYHNGLASKFKHHEFVNDRPVYFIQLDLTNNMWIGTNDGAWKINRYHAWPFSIENGLSGRETNRSAAVRDTKGRMWIGTNAGVSCYKKEYNLTNLQKPVLSLVNLENSIGEIYGLNNDFNIKYNHNSLTFHFTAISFTNEKRNVVQARLAGFDKDWITLPSADLRTLRYTNLPPGNYFFKLRAKGDNGQWSDVLSSGQITVNRAFYTRWWFFLLLFAIVAGVLYPLLKYLQQKRNATVLKAMVEERTQNLTSSENNLRSILEHSTDGILISDKDGKVVNANNSFSQLVNLSHEDLMQSNVIELSRHFMMETPLTVDRYREIFHERKTNKGFESSAVIKGKTYFLQINRAFINAPVADEYYMVSMFHDITEMKNTQQVLIKSKEIAETATATKSVFLASMSHEIRTPLNGIIGLSDLLQHTALDEEQQEFVNGLQQSSRTLLALINDILDFSKIESGKMELVVESVFVPQMVEEVFEILSSRAIEKQIDFTYFIEPSVPAAIQSDSIRLKQILLNLLSNGIKFTDTGYVGLSVRNNTITQNLEFEIRDSGIGIPADKVSSLFNSFTQISNTKTANRGGTGLGLAISKRLAALMNGNIEVSTVENEGSAFTLTIPCVESNDYNANNKFINEQKSLSQNLQNTNLFVIDGSSFAMTNIAREARKYGIEAQKIKWADFENNLEYYYNQPVIIHQKDIEANPEILGWLNANTKVLQGMIVLNFETRSWQSSYSQFTDKYSLPVRYRAFFKYLANKISRLNDLSGFVTVAKVRPAQNKAPQFLIVDDIATNTMILAKLLGNHGYTCDVALNGQEALEKARRTHYPVILMDINMPVMNGWEASLAIREFEKTINSHSTIIAITANALEQDKQKCFDCGMDYFFSKPFDFKTLIDLIESLHEDLKAKEISL